MSGENTVRKNLRLVRGRKDGIHIGTASLSVASAAESPDAVVLEEDTWLVLSAEPKVTMPTEHPIRIFTELHRAQPLVPGTVIARGERPLTLLAVVYDLSVEPSCRSEWITSALSGILSICRERGLRSVLLPLFGVRHAKMQPDIVLPLIIRAIREEASGLPVAIHMQVPPEAEGDVRQLLVALSGNGAEGK